MMNESKAQHLNIETLATYVPDVEDTTGHMTELRHDVISAANDRQFLTFLPTFVLICILMSFGIPGNLCALVVYVTRMKKAIARQFFITLATCDLLTCLVVMSTELDIMKRFFLWDMQYVCKCFRWLAYMTNNLSNFTLLAIAIERYILVCKPWKQKWTSSIKSKICYMNASIAIITSLPMFFIYGSQNILLHKSSRNKQESTDGYSITENLTTSNGSDVTDIKIYGTSCLMDENMMDSKFPNTIVVIYIVGIVITFFVLIVLYGNVLKTLLERRKQSLCQQKEKHKKDSTNRIRKVTFMMVVLTALYEICYLPCLVTVCIRLMRPDFYGTLSNLGKIIFQLMLKSYLLCSAFNPYVYGFCNKEFISELSKFYKNVLPSNESIERNPQSSRTRIMETEDFM
ncbi:G-protein coupled receptor 1 [Mactra antiquata]